MIIIVSLTLTTDHHAKKQEYKSTYIVASS